VPTGLRQRTISLMPGSPVLMFSDGLIEARGAGVAGEQDLLGREGLRELLAELPRGFDAEAILAAVREQTQATPDDMAACLLAAGAPPELPVVDIEELELEARALEAGHVRRFLEESGVDAVQTQSLLDSAATAIAAGRTALLLLDRSGETVSARMTESTQPAREDGRAQLGGNRSLVGA
jgi:hypothetical protein